MKPLVGAPQRQDDDRRVRLKNRFPDPRTTRTEARRGLVPAVRPAAARHRMPPTGAGLGLGRDHVALGSPALACRRDSRLRRGDPLSGKAR